MFKQINKVDKLINRSINILSVFTSTISDLEDVNSKIADEAEIKLEKEKSLQDAAQEQHDLWDELKDQQTANQKIISKIQQFLKD